MYSLITRPKLEAEDFALELVEIGFVPVIDSLLEIDFPKNSWSDVNQDLRKDVQSIVVTSGNAIRALSKHAHVKKIPLYVIGDKSLEVAKRKGFYSVTNGGDNASELVEHLSKNLKSEGGKIIYLSGNVVTLDITRALKGQGFDCVRYIVYTSKEANSLSTQLIQIILEKKLSIATFFSARTAEVFVKLVQESDIKLNLSKTKVFSLSEKISKILSSLDWKEMHVAKKPNQESLLEILKKKQNVRTK